MPIKISLGLSKKLGLPAYSSVGASCQVECEVDSAILQQGAERFHQEAERLFGLCRQAVHDQLAREVPPNGALRTASNGHIASTCAAKPGARPDPAVSCVDSNGDEEAQTEVGLSERQLAFIQDLAGQIRGLGIRRLPALVAIQFDRNLTELTSGEASRLIDWLRQVRSGELPLERLLEQETAER
jgi:hypothetical protein